MKEQELRDIFHAYRPKIDDNDEFMDKLMAQMDAEDTRRRDVTMWRLYRKMLPWVAGIAAAVIVAVFIMKEPDTTSPATSSYEPRTPDYYHSTPSHPDFASYEDIVNEIERSGQQLENAIAQL
jgi:hypothetical protein